VLVIVTGILLAMSLRWPRSRRKVAIGTWLTVVATFGWYAFYFYGGWQSYKVHY
jgi:hypothetical protein